MAPSRVCAPRDLCRRILVEEAFVNAYFRTAVCEFVSRKTNGVLAGGRTAAVGRCRSVAPTGIGLIRVISSDILRQMFSRCRNPPRCGIGIVDIRWGHRVVRGKAGPSWRGSRFSELMIGTLDLGSPTRGYGRQYRILCPGELECRMLGYRIQDHQIDTSAMESCKRSWLHGSIFRKVERQE
jgi:hypothetical protein